MRLPQIKGLVAGMFGRAEFTTGTAKGLFVPKTELWQESSLEGVYVVENGVAVKRLVTTGKRVGNFVEVLSGLKEDELVVVSDLEKLRDGIKVRILR